MQISTRGALVGAGLGAVARSVVIMVNLGVGTAPIFYLPSAIVGVLVGAIAGATGRPLRGALLGAFLSAVVFELFMLPCVSLLGTLGATELAGNFMKLTLFFALQMGVAGALAGGIGGWVGQQDNARAADRAQRETPEPPAAL